MIALLLGSLASAAVRAFALGFIAGAGLTIFRVRSTSMRLFTWSAVLYAALAMPLLQTTLPSLRVPAPAFLKHQTDRPALTPVLASRPKVATALDGDSAAPSAVTPAPQLTTGKSFDWSTIRWSELATVIYCTMAFLLLARFCVGLAFGYRLRRASQLICEPNLTAILDARAHAFGTSGPVEVAESTFISVPVTMGVFRPMVFLPTSWREWDEAKLDAVIAHEVSHVARRDTLTQRLSLMHCTIFWFSPLAWWLNRRLADLMEQASDEAALAGGADRKVYARTLLSFFEALQAAPGRVWWQGVAMADANSTARRAEERVEKILSWKGSVSMRLKKSMAVVVVALAVPVVYLTASAQSASADHQNTNRVEIAQGQAPPAPAAHARRTPKKQSNHSFYSYSDDDSMRFVIASGNNDSLTMSGMHGDAEQVDELRKKIPGDFIWFRRDGKSYVIRDQATIDRAKALWAPQEELGKKQEELGKQQEALGKQQEELSAKMEQIQVTVPDMTAELEKLQAEMKALSSSGATVEQLGHFSERIGELQSKIGDIQSRAGEQQGKLGDEMGVLGEKQGKLGEQQGELGRQQGELAEQANRKMKQILDESVTKGTAQVEP